MSRSKQDILDTESMLVRLTNLLAEHRKAGDVYGCRPDAESLRRVSMTLRAWHELECNGDVEVNETTGNAKRRSGLMDVTWSIPNRERGALKRLKVIMSRYPSLQAYVQGDPRGCALYVLKPGDVPEGADVSAYYSRGLAVYR